MKIKQLVQILLSSFIFSTLAAVPSEINYQGLITDSDGDPIESATNSVAVNLYQVETGGTAVYTQSFTQVASDANGITPLCKRRRMAGLKRLSSLGRQLF